MTSGILAAYTDCDAAYRHIESLLAEKRVDWQRIAELLDDIDASLASIDPSACSPTTAAACVEAATAVDRRRRVVSDLLAPHAERLRQARRRLAHERHGIKAYARPERAEQARFIDRDL